MPDPAFDLGPQHLLDNDLYKFTMQQAVLELYPDAQVEYRFTNRRLSDKFTPAFLLEFKKQLENMRNLSVESGEIKRLGERLPFLKPHYLEYLKHYRYDPSEVIYSLDEDGRFDLAVRGSWHRTILWEVPLMALISECYFRHCDNSWETHPWIKIQESLAAEKGRRLNEAGCRWADFGTRRRRNWQVQNIVVTQQKAYEGFVGTSNVWLALEHGVAPIGTMAHEWPMGVSALEGLRYANRIGLYKWNEVYQGNLGIALTDTYTTDRFFGNDGRAPDFDSVLARIYDGVRQDSDCPFKFTDKAHAFYTGMRIPPKSKASVFSDSLNVDKAIEIQRYAEDKLNPLFGIGTHLTNDFEGSHALNMVIKLWSVNGIPVVKLSDDPGKAQGDSDAVKVAKWTFLGQGLNEEETS